MIRKYQSNLEACVLSFEFLNVNNKDGIGLWNNAWESKLRSLQGPLEEIELKLESKASGEGDILKWARQVEKETSHNERAS